MEEASESPKFGEAAPFVNDEGKGPSPLSLLLLHPELQIIDLRPSTHRPVSGSFLTMTKRFEYDEEDDCENCPYCRRERLLFLSDWAVNHIRHHRHFKSITIWVIEFMSQPDNVQILLDYVDSFEDNGRGFMKDMYEEARKAMDVAKIGDAKVRIMFGAIVRQVWIQYHSDQCALVVVRFSFRFLFVSAQAFYTDIELMKEYFIDEVKVEYEAMKYSIFCDETLLCPEELEEEVFLLDLGDKIIHSRVSVGQSLLFSSAGDQCNLSFFLPRIRISIRIEGEEIYLSVYEKDRLKGLVIMTGISTKRYLIRNITRGKPYFASDRAKTFVQLGVKDGDMLEAIEMKQESSVAIDAGPINSKVVKARSKKTKKKTKRASKRAKPTTVKLDKKTDHRFEHSKLLSDVFVEAEPTFKDIRQRLNALLIHKSKPKQRVSTPTEEPPSDDAFTIAFTDDGVKKAGKTVYHVLVGQPDSLYVSSKKKATPQCANHFSIDLHGCSKDQAAELLDSAVQTWIDSAMTGNYPWVVRVDIVCGGGAQILGETVEQWIKEQKNVAHRPKSF
jgi:DNA-nicking Smr family endonuclease